MLNLKVALANSAAVQCAGIGSRSAAGYRSKRRWKVRFPELKIWSAIFRAAGICAFILCVASGTTVRARGGHGMAGFGMHGGKMGERGSEGLLTPTYVLITISKITNAEDFKATMQDLMAPEMLFAGRIAVDMDKPVSWEGTASEHVVLIQFENPVQAQVWKNSDSFKSFDAELHRSSESTMQLVQGLPMPAALGIARGRRGRGRLDPKAFEPNVKEYDQMLNKMSGICKGC
jgi:uncharacterized protein (DUF1330 family)